MMDEEDQNNYYNIGELSNSKNQEDIDQVCNIVHNLILKNVTIH